MEDLDRAIGMAIESVRGWPYLRVEKVHDSVPHLSPEDVAAAAREVGIPWRRGTVRAIEKGSRKVWAIEFVLLGEIFRRAWARKGIDVRPFLEDFLPEGRVVAGTVQIDGGGLQEAVRGRPFPPEAITELEPNAYPEPGMAARLEARKTIPERELPPSLDLRRLGREAQGDAEVKLARKLGVDPEAIVIAAHLLWGVGLATKRDLELGDVQGLEQESIQRKRGRVTLRLAEDLADKARSVQHLLTDLPGRSPQPPPGAPRNQRG